MTVAASGINGGASHVITANNTILKFVAQEGNLDPKTRQNLLYAAAVLSLVTALIHLWVMPEHFAEWWGYGLFFLVAAAQALFAFAIMRAATANLLRVGIVGNLAVIILWIVTRTIGIPFFGPHAGEIEAVGAIDVMSKLTEAFLVVLLGLLLWQDGVTSRRSSVA